MKNIKRGAAASLAVLLSLCAVTACNFKQSASHTANDDYADKIKKTEIMPVITEQQPQNYIVSPEQMCMIGEAVDGTDIQNGNLIPDALIYTFNKSTIFADSSEAGIEESAILDKNGNQKPGVKILLLELTVQNVRAKPEQNITSLQILCANTESLSSGSGEASFYELFPGEPVYFSNHGVKDEYYDYQLPVGQSMNFKVAWYVDTDQYDPANLYLTLNSDEYQKYIKLE